MSRVSYNMVKQWVAESDFAKEHNMKVGSWNGYYYVTRDGEILVSGKTPSELWYGFCLMRTGYYMGKDENK